MADIIKFNPLSTVWVFGKPTPDSKDVQMEAELPAGMQLEFDPLVPPEELTFAGELYSFTLVQVAAADQSAILSAYVYTDDLVAHAS